MGQTRKPSRTDEGMTFIEVLIAVVLMGTGVLAIMTALQATTIATATERDHARALQWLQSASEALVNDAPWQPCSVTPAAAKIAYEGYLKGDANIRPPSWAPAQLTISGSVLYGQPGGTYSSTCIAAIERQLVKLQVSDPEGDIVETLEVVVIP